MRNPSGPGSSSAPDQRPDIREQLNLAVFFPSLGNGGANHIRFAVDHDIDLVRFERHERKDDRTRAYLRDFQGDEGVLYMGVAQEKARVLRTERRVDPAGGAYPWLVSSTAMVNHYYVYIVDEDFGPLFVKFCSYFPYNAKLCINGHEYLKRQLAKRGVAFEALDNGIASCADPGLMRRLAEECQEFRVRAVSCRTCLVRRSHQPLTNFNIRAGLADPSPPNAG